MNDNLEDREIRVRVIVREERHGVQLPGRKSRSWTLPVSADVVVGEIEKLLWRLQRKGRRGVV